ncbi:MAG: ferredoxin [Candidatus Bathyarchaeum sp.]|nr:MAG: ferredoxin [Candidatus Bathyarchaeum sp.]
MMHTIIVDWNRCSGKGTCIDVCPTAVFELQDIKEHPETLKAVPIKLEECIVCMKCIQVCSEQAITVKKNNTNISAQKEKD